MNAGLIQLDTILRQKLPGLPASEGNQAGVSLLQKSLPRLLPVAFLEFMLWKPRGLQISFDWDWEGAVTGFLLEPEEMEQFVGEWREPSPEGTLHWWEGHWIPVLGSGGDFLCLDLIGTFHNPPGSLLCFYEEKPNRSVVFPSFESWLRWIACALEQNLGRVFLAEGRLEFVLGRKVDTLYHELFPNYPLQKAAEILGVGLLDRVLNRVRKAGLEVRCQLPPELTPQELVTVLSRDFIREEGQQGDSLRVQFFLPSQQVALAELRPSRTKALLTGIVLLPESAASLLGNARSLVGLGQSEGAARRLCEAAFHCYQAELLEEAMVILRRALQLHPSNDLAQRSLAALEAKEVRPESLRLRPLLQHLYS